MARGRGGSGGWARTVLDSGDSARLLAATRGIEGGAVLRRQWSKRQIAAARPAVTSAKAAIRSMPSTGRSRGPSMRAAIARTIRATARASVPSVSIVVGRPTLRGFATAGLRTQERSWRHPLFGDTARWFNQTGKPGWFLNAVQSHRGEFAKASKSALDDFAKDLARRM